MQTTSALYRQLINDSTAVFEIKCAIGITEYTQTSILSMSTSGTCYSSNMPTIGGVLSKEIDITVLNPSQMPRTAQIRPYIRLTNGVDTSEWVSKGVFYVDTRQRDVVSNTVQIHGYDSIIRTEKYLYRCLPPDYQQSFSWSSTDTMAAIANYLGVTIDSRSNIVQCQIYDPQAETSEGHGMKMEELIMTPMRTVAGWIAAASGGNWIITDDGKLRLLPCMPQNPDTQYIYAAASAMRVKSDELIPYTGVELVGAATTYFVGDETGRVITGECPFATAQMASDILASLTSTYIPHEVLGAFVDPAMELGDVVFAGLPSKLYPLMLSDVTTNFDRLSTCDLRADDYAELEHEYTVTDVSKTLTILRQYAGETFAQDVFVVPDGYFYNIPNQYLEVVG